MRLPVSALAGVLAALLLFLLMHQLLGPQQAARPADMQPVVINVPIRVLPEEPETVREPPPEPERMTTPPEVPRLEMQTAQEPETEAVEFELPRIGPGYGGGPSLPDGAYRSGSRSAAPGSNIVIRPVYPPKAIRAGLEGFVTLQIDLAPDGSVTAAKVVDSEPGRVFDAAALRAVYRSRFAPPVEGGRAVSGQILQTVYFKLDDES